MVSAAFKNGESNHNVVSRNALLILYMYHTYQFHSMKTPAGGCLFYGQINNIQRNINIQLKHIKFLSPLRYRFNVQVKLVDLSGA